MSKSSDSALFPLPPETRITAIANQKGGVGKSTTVVNMSAWLALEGASVLIIDLDPQSNATTGVGVDPRRVTGNIYQILVEGKPMEDCVEPTAVRNLYCVSSNIDLAGAEIELVPAFSRELKLKRALEPILGDYDYVMIDCPPSLGLLTINALAAAQELVVPIQCEYYALEGLGQLLKNVNLVQTGLNPELSLSGILLTMYDARTRLAEQVASEVRSHFPGKVFAATVPRSIRLAEAPSFGQPVALHDPRSRGSVAYRDAAGEFARRFEPAPSEKPPREPTQSPVPQSPAPQNAALAPVHPSAAPDLSSGKEQSVENPLALEPIETIQLPNGLPASPLDAVLDAAEPGLGGSEGSYVAPRAREGGSENSYAEATPSEAAFAAGPAQESSTPPGSLVIPEPWLATDEERP